jgi:hypothetical protein
VKKLCWRSYFCIALLVELKLFWLPIGKNSFSGLAKMMKDPYWPLNFLFSIFF